MHVGMNITFITYNVCQICLTKAKEMAAASKKKWNYLLVTYRQKDEAEKPFTHTHKETQWAKKKCYDDCEHKRKKFQKNGNSIWIGNLFILLQSRSIFGCLLNMSFSVRFSLSLFFSSICLTPLLPAMPASSARNPFVFFLFYSLSRSIFHSSVYGKFTIRKLHVVDYDYDL